MISPEQQVSAVVVTRGNVDLTRVRESLIFSDIVIFDNSHESEDLKTQGIIEAVCRTKHQIVFAQDDDIVHTAENQRMIVAAYEPGVLTGCMWQEWSDGARAQGIPGGYDDLVFYGSGSVFDRTLPTQAALRYLDHYPADDFFLLWFSCIFGIIAPTNQLDLRFDALPCAEDEDRMCNLPNAVENKTEAIRRARSVRDQKWDAHAHYLMEQSQGHHPESRYL